MIESVFINQPQFCICVAVGLTKHEFLKTEISLLLNIGINLRFLQEKKKTLKKLIAKVAKFVVWLQ